MLSSLIVPAVIPKSLIDLEVQLGKLTGLPELHLDVVDGKFVPHTSWPHNSKDKPKTIKTLLDTFSLEVDLMVEDPVVRAEEWLEAGADALVFHAETISRSVFKEFCLNAKVSIGISANNNTAESVLNEYVPFADYVQVMGIGKIGSQGQSFDYKSLDRITSLQKNFPGIVISIDGSVNSTTLPIIAPHKPNRYIVGSAIMKHSKPLEAYQKLNLLYQQLT